MNKRAITWLLAALLAVAANAAVPVVRARTGRATSSIVWIAQDKTEQQVPVQPGAVHKKRATLSIPYLAPANPQSPNPVLYQRPPPSLR